MNSFRKCKHCGKETKNKKFCSRQCQQDYKFLHQRRHRSKLEKYLLEKLSNDFRNLRVVGNERNTLLHEHLELDIYLPQLRIAFEINGKMHYEYNEYFHGSYKNFLRQRQRDEKKKLLCRQRGIILITIPNFKEFTPELGEQIYNTQVRPFILNYLNFRI